MFGEISLLVVLQGAALIAAGAATGYFLALQRFDKQRDKLKDELEETRSELKQHREQVDSHFLKTGLLFNRLTDNYREIYEHLATGAQNLCSPQVNKQQLDQPETRVLPASVAAAQSGEEDSELAATQSPHPDVDAAVNTQLSGTDEQRAEEKDTAPAEVVDTKPATDGGDEPQSAASAEPSTPEDSAEKKPAAEAVAALDEKTPDDEHLGADAAPAPTINHEDIAADLPPASETSVPVDQHKSPPSIH